MDKKIKKLTLLPPRLDVCPECATKHIASEPHNKDNLYYQIQFRTKNGRWPTWEDALSHCNEKTKKDWRRELIQMNININA